MRWWPFGKKKNRVTPDDNTVNADWRTVAMLLLNVYEDLIRAVEEESGTDMKVDTQIAQLRQAIQTMPASSIVIGWAAHNPGHLDRIVDQNKAELAAREFAKAAD